MFNRRQASATTTAEPAAERNEREQRFTRDRPLVAAETMSALRARQRDRFGGFSWGADFFGWLAAAGLASILAGIVAAAGAALGLTKGSTDKIGLGGGIALLAVLFVAYVAGGYVAGRMARFDGLRQGIGVWVWTLVIAAAVAIAAVIGGTQYNVLQQLNLPNVAVGDQSLTTGGWLTLAAAVVVTLIFAVLGGKAGDLFHRRVDRFATRDYVETA